MTHTGGVMERQIDYQAIFKRIPAVMVALSPDFTILDVSDETAELTGRKAEDLIGRDIFDTFRPNPGDSGEPGPRDLRASLESVVATGERDVLPLVRYDLEDPGRPGVFDVRYWAIVNIPVMADGHVSQIMFRAMDMTHLIRAAAAMNC
ncbi:MAG: PAS domain S-box protein [Streptosporangiaceae bacterium]